MIVLGIDPGIAITGCAVVKEEKGRLTIIHHETIITSQKLPTPERLFKLHKQLVVIIKKYRPDVIALEHLFFNTNAKTALLIGQATGIIQLTAAQNKILVIEYTPLQVKMALTGYGRADKSQIQHMVKNVLKLPKILTPDDVADSVAIALTHCFSYKLKKMTNN